MFDGRIWIGRDQQLSCLLPCISCWFWNKNLKSSISKIVYPNYVLDWNLKRSSFLHLWPCISPYMMSENVWVSKGRICLNSYFLVVVCNSLYLLLALRCLFCRNVYNYYFAYFIQLYETTKCIIIVAVTMFLKTNYQSLTSTW